MRQRSPIRYIERHRAKMRLIRKRELDKIERKVFKMKIVLRRGK